MSAPFRRWSTLADTNVTVTTTTETEAIQLDGVTLSGTGRRVKLAGRLVLTTGTGTTTVTCRIRRGTDTTGTLVGEATAVTVGAAAGSNEVFGVAAVDTVDDVAGASYTLTVQQAGATGNGTVLTAGLDANTI